MNMQEHILTALRELFNKWQDLLARLNEAQVTAPLLPSPWSIKDEIVHLWAWQQHSIARMEAALSDRAPELPGWFPRVDEHLEGHSLAFILVSSYDHHQEHYEKFIARQQEI